MGCLRAAIFVLLFARPATLLFDAWWNDPNSGHGLLLAPLLPLACLQGGYCSPRARPQHVLGFSILLLAVVSRYAAELAAELFVMRGSMLMALGGHRDMVWRNSSATALVVAVCTGCAVHSNSRGRAQHRCTSVAVHCIQRSVRHCSSGVIFLCLMSGNVIRIPGQELFVAEACSGLRSLTALISLGVLMGALFLQTWPARLLLVAITIPVAIVINGVRVFLTGFLVLFVSPEMGQGFMHTSEGMVMFGGAFLITALITWGFGYAERFILKGRGGGGANTQAGTGEVTV